jgi:hypothetical protein
VAAVVTAKVPTVTGFVTPLVRRPQTEPVMEATGRAVKTDLRGGARHARRIDWAVHREGDWNSGATSRQAGGQAGGVAPVPG